jgi:transcription antitermination factor NusG
MPILDREPDLFPADLFDQLAAPDDQRSWWAFYTLSRQEKEFMRKLRGHQIPFYGPLIPKRVKSPAGRIRTSYVPLFSNYVFVYGGEEQRYKALTTNCVSQVVPVVDNEQLTRDLRQFHDLIQMDVPLLAESRLEPGTRVRIRSGRFSGIEGTILRRENEIRLLVAVNFIQRGASMLLEDFEVEAI